MYWNGLRCQMACTFQALSRMAVISSSAEEDRPGRSERSVGLAALRGSITLKFQLARGISSRSGTPDHAFLGDQISSLTCRRPLGKSPTAVTQAPYKRGSTF